MKQKNHNLVVVVILVVIGVVGIFYLGSRNILVLSMLDKISSMVSVKNMSCPVLEKGIVSMLQKANYCTKDTDCTYKVRVGYPANCHSLVNVNSDIGAMESLYSQYVKKCNPLTYDCDRAPTQEEVKCMENKCVDSRYKNLH